MRCNVVVEDLTPKAAKKHQQILWHALRVFAREGFGNADVQVIADLAGVGKGTVYRHFGNKEQLFLATARHCLEQLADFIRKRVVGSQDAAEFIQQVGAAELMRRIAQAYAEFYERNPQAVEIMIQERATFRDAVVPSHLMHRAETRAEFDQFLSDAMKRGELRQVDVAQATNAFADLVYGSVVNGCLEGGKGRLVERVLQAVEILLNGLILPQSQSQAQPCPPRPEA